VAITEQGEEQDPLHHDEHRDGYPEGEIPQAIGRSRELARGRKCVLRATRLTADRDQRQHANERDESRPPPLAEVNKSHSVSV
jgi:hypothetical protein